LTGFLRKNGRLEEKVALKVFIDILNGFSELLKKGIVHRDLKPDNILINDGVNKLAGNIII
jgi:serine/threonine protein kinase